MESKAFVSACNDREMRTGAPVIEYILKIKMHKIK